MKTFDISFFKTLYEYSPNAVWIIDFTKALKRLEDDKDKLGDDIVAHLIDHPDKAVEYVKLLNVKSANRATLQLTEAKSAEELNDNIHHIMPLRALTNFLETIEELQEGSKRVERDGVIGTIGKEQKRVRISWSIIEGKEHPLEHVIVSMQDICELQEANVKLAEQETLFRCIFEQASDGIMILDKNLDIILANCTLTEHTGMNMDEFIGKNLLEFHQSYVKEIQLETKIDVSDKGLKELIKKQNAGDFVLEYSFFDKRGKIRSQKQTMVLLEKEDDHLYTLIVQDLTSLKRSQMISNILHEISHAVNVVESLEDLFHIIHKSLGKLIDVTNFFIALYDSKLNIITFPYLVDEVNDDSSPLDIQDGSSLTAQIILGEKSMLMEYQDIEDWRKEKGVVGTMCKNFLGIPLIIKEKVIGAIVIQSYTSNDLYDEDDKILLESISEQIAFALHKKQADEDITVLFQAIEQAGDGIIIFNPDGTIKYVNTVFERISSFRRIELLGKPIEVLPFDDASRAEIQKFWLRVRSSQPWRGRLNMVRKDGMVITLELSVKPVIDEEGRLSNIIASCKDVTYELMREEQQKRTQRLEAVGRLTGGIAHDFNNILSAIIGYAELAGDDMHPESEAADSIMEVLKSAGRAKEMIAHLLAFSRQEEAKTEVIELAEHVRESIRFLRSYIPRSIKIAENITSERTTMIAVPGQIHQIIINLGTNAMHALNREDALIQIDLDQVSFTSDEMKSFPELEQSQYLKVSVTDNGTGIDPAILENIYDPYFTTKAANEGTGLGLSVVYSIVEYHKGAIRIESELGKGTTFHVYMPMYIPDAWHQNGREPDVINEVEGHETIMFVDDEPALVSVFRQGLMRLGYKVEGYIDPRKALEQFKKNPDRINMVVTDTTMPYINGVDLAEQMLEIRKDLPIILCTGFTTLISVDEARNKGIKDFVMKPFKIRDIAARIREIFDGENS